MINLFQPNLGEDEIAAIREVFESGWLGRGSRTDAFERNFADHLGVSETHVRSLPSCTEGLFLSMELLGVGPGDEVVLPTVSFVGAGNAVAARGAATVFCDVDFRTLNPRVEQIEAALTERTKAIVLIHYGGLPADIEGICALARERGVAVVEDSACSISSAVNGKRCGTLGDFGLWSFDSMKILVTADGGMIYVRDPELAEKAKELTYMGLKAASGFSQASSASRWWEFEISSFSRRAIINDVTAAMGLVQLEKLPGFITRRREIHERYSDELTGFSWLTLPPELPAGHQSSYYFYWVQTRPELRDALARELLDQGIYTTFRYWPLHLVSLYGSTASLPEAEAATRQTLCIPLHHGLTDDEVSAVIDAIRSFDRHGVAA